MTQLTRAVQVALALLVVVCLVPSSQASATWDGPVNAAIDQVALTLQNLGLEGAVVKPFGYGFEITSAATVAEQEEALDSMATSRENAVGQAAIPVTGLGRETSGGNIPQLAAQPQPQLATAP